MVATTFDAARALLEELLAGPGRQQIVAEARQAENLREALLSLRTSMRSHRWTFAGETFDFGRAI